MGRTRIKICGLTQATDIQAAVSAGADSIGLVFCQKSPRHLELDQAKALVAEIPAFVSVVALFLNPEKAMVDAVLDQVHPDMLQFHGQEDAGFCTQFKRRYLKAIAMGKNAEKPVEQARAHPSACGYVLDSHAPGAIGGTGKTFDWGQIELPSKGLILAGGLHPGNVGAAVEQVRPWAVDVSSGVESAPGIKSAAKIQGFIRAVADADRRQTMEN